jgi:hypothetical protein
MGCESMRTVPSAIVLLVLFTTMAIGLNVVGIASTTDRNQSVGLRVQEAANPYTLAWNTTWGANYNDYGMGVAVDLDRNVYITGMTYTPATQSDVFVAKYNATGSLLWNVTYDKSSDADVGYDIDVNSSGYAFVAGYANAGLLGGRDGIFLIYTPAGSLGGYSYFGAGGSGDDEAYGIKVTAKGDVVIVGKAEAPLGDDNLMVYQYTDGGMTWDWGKIWGGTGDEEGHGVAVDENGDIYVAGTTTSYGPGLKDTLLVKYDTAGNFKWNKSLGTSYDEEERDIVISSAYCFSTGQSYSAVTGYDIRINKYPKIDEGTWYYNWWKDSGQEGATGIAMDADENLYICGYTDSIAVGSYDAIITQYSSSLGHQWNMTWGGSQYEEARDIKLDNRGNIYVAGSTQSFGAAGYNAFILKYAIDSDGDGLTDDDELDVYDTNPSDVDSDNDGYSDGVEASADTSPLDPNDYPGAGIPGFQMSYMLLGLILVAGLLMLRPKFKAVPNEV